MKEPQTEHQRQPQVKVQFGQRGPISQFDCHLSNPGQQHERQHGDGRDQPSHHGSRGDARRGALAQAAAQQHGQAQRPQQQARAGHDKQPQGSEEHVDVHGALSAAAGRRGQYVPSSPTTAYPK
jgi:hypothetical protein